MCKSYLVEKKKNDYVVKALDRVQELIQIILRHWVLFLLGHRPSVTASKLLIIWL